MGGICLIIRVLVISPHPDDDAIGCGGTIRKHIVEGDSLRVIYLSSGERGCKNSTPEKIRLLREQEAREAAKILGITRIEFWRMPDSALSANQKAVKRLRTVIFEWIPELIYVTHNKEMHSDHKAAAKMVKIALTGIVTPTKRPIVRMYEVWTPLQRIDEIVDISTYIKAKIEAIKAHKSQCNVLHFDDAFLGLGRYRGELFSWPEGDYAEVFTIMKIK